MARCILLYRPGDAILPRRQLDVTFPDERLAEQVWSGAANSSRLPANVRASLERLHRELRPSSHGVDWTPVRLRRRQAEARIGVMERYARDRRCRRAALIDYFGERITRCAGCDVCSGAPVRPLARPEAERRLARLRAALGHLHAPWGGCPLEPETLRRLAHHAPQTESEMAAVEGVGRVIARRFGRTILMALIESDP
jgi:superfamily II DNA helicase RecQ